MTVDQIRSLQDAAPFRAFRLHMANGKSVRAPHPDFMSLSPTGRILTVYRAHDSFEVIDTLLVTSIETLPQSFEGWSNAGIASHGGCLMLNFTEWPSAAAVCSLSEVLETEVAPKYFLSPKACRGILRRAEKRGRELPMQLQRALDRVAAQETEAEIP